MKNKIIGVFFAVTALIFCLSVSAFAAIDLDSDDILELSTVESLTECYSVGDADGNGKVTAADARLILRVSVNLDAIDASAFVKSDIDGNGKITAQDARLALRLAVGLEEFPEHQIEEIVIISSTCKTEGLSVKVCTSCMKIYAQFTTPSDKHVGGLWETVTQATCMNEGKAVMKCVFCNEVMKETTISKTGHTGEWNYPEGKSCLNPVPKNRTCTVCGNYEEATENPPAKHNFKWVEVVERTCTVDGIDVYKCTHCGQESESRTIAAKGHLYERTVMVKEPTCTETGIRGDQCVFCNDVINEVTVSALGHDYNNKDYKVTKEPTCYEAGTADVICSACSEAKEIELSMVEHTLIGEWAETLAPTCTEAGTASGVCEFCGDVTKEIPALGHTVEKWVNVKAPTCAEEGIRQGYCSTCGDEAAQEAIEKTSHTFNEKDKNGNLIIHHTSGVLCKEDGEGYILCTACGEKKYGRITAIGKCVAGSTEVITEADCTTAKKTVDICKYCDEKIAGSEKTSGSALGHQWGEWVDTKEVTCAEDGIRTNTCSVCSATKTEPVPSYGHTHGEWVTVTVASCTEKGLKTQSCTVCDSVLATATTDMLPHTPGKTVIEKPATATEEGKCTVYCSVCENKIETKPFSRILVEGNFEIEFIDTDDVSAGATVSFRIKNAADSMMVRFTYGSLGIETDIAEADGIYSFVIPEDIAETDVITIRIFGY